MNSIVYSFCQNHMNAVSIFKTAKSVAGTTEIAVINETTQKTYFQDFSKISGAYAYYFIKSLKTYFLSRQVIELVNSFVTVDCLGRCPIVPHLQRKKYIYS